MLDELGRRLGPDVELVVTGGGASGELFMQIIADVFGVTAHRLELPPGASPAGLGAAACAAAAIGLHPSIEDAALAITPARHRVTGRSAPHALYGRIAADVQPVLRDATDPIFRRTYPLFHDQHPDREDLP
jgi:sugar (pentulose or hexulose) kinase